MGQKVTLKKKFRKPRGLENIGNFECCITYGGPCRLQVRRSTTWAIEDCLRKWSGKLYLNFRLTSQFSTARSSFSNGSGLISAFNCPLARCIFLSILIKIVSYIHFENLIRPLECKIHYLILTLPTVSITI